MMKRILALLLALSLLLSVSAVFAEEPADAAPTEEAAEPVASSEEEAEPAKLLVTLNGEEIREDNGSLQSYYEYYLEQMEEDEPHREELSRMYAMDMTLKVRLINQYANKDLTAEQSAAYAEQAASEWEDILKNYMEQYYSITEESSEEDQAAARADTLALLESQGWTEERYLHEETEALIYNGFLTGIGEQMAANPDLAASEEEIQEAFQERVEEDRDLIGDNAAIYEIYPQYLGTNPFYRPEGYRGITHILLKVDQALLDAWTDLTARLEEAAAPDASEDETEDTEDAEEAPAADEESADTAEETAEEPAATEEPVTQEMVDQAVQAILDSVGEKITAIQEKLAAGTSFEELIAEYSEDPGMQDAEYLQNGYAVHKDSIQYDASFTEAASKLEKVGDVSDPVVTQFGVHILYYLRDIPGGAVEMTDAIRAELVETIESEKQNDAFLDLLDQWLAEAEIVWTEDGASWKYDEELIDQYTAEAEEDEEEDEDSAEEEETEEEAEVSAE